MIGIKSAIGVTVLLVCLFGLSNAAAEKDPKSVEEDVDTRMKLITGCWMLSFRKMGHDKDKINQQLVKNSLPRESLLKKIKLDMIKACYEQINLKDAETLVDIMGTSKDHPFKYEQVNPVFTYNAYADPAHNVTLSYYDTFLLDLTEKLQTEVSDMLVKEANRLVKSINAQQNSFEIFGVSIDDYSYFMGFLFLSLVGAGVYLGFRAVNDLSNDKNKQKQKKSDETVQKAN